MSDKYTYKEDRTGNYTIRCKNRSCYLQGSDAYLFERELEAVALLQPKVPWDLKQILMNSYSHVMVVDPPV